MADAALPPSAAYTDWRVEFDRRFLKCRLRMVESFSTNAFAAVISRRRVLTGTATRSVSVRPSISSSELAMVVATSWRVVPSASARPSEIPPPLISPSMATSHAVIRARSVPTESQRALDSLFGAYSCRRTGAHPGSGPGQAFAGICAKRAGRRQRGVEALNGTRPGPTLAATERPRLDMSVLRVDAWRRL